MKSYPKPELAPVTSATFRSKSNKAFPVRAAIFGLFFSFVLRGVMSMMPPFLFWLPDRIYVPDRWAD